MSSGFGLVPKKTEGKMIDPVTFGDVETPEREAELRIYYARLAAEDAAFNRSLRGKWAHVRSRVRRAWRVLAGNEDSGL